MLDEVKMEMHFQRNTPPPWFDQYQTFKDITIFGAEDMKTPVKAHKHVLVAVSETLKNILPECPGQDAALILDGVTSQEVQMFLDLIYKGTCSVPPHAIINLVDLLERMGIGE